MTPILDRTGLLMEPKVRALRGRAKFSTKRIYTLRAFIRYVDEAK